MSGSVVCVGVFDGVHRGHQALVERARSVAGEAGTVIAATFFPHPGSVLRPDGAPPSLATLPDRASLLRRAGADDVAVLNFTPSFAEMSPRDFAVLLRERFDARAVVVGTNFRFGTRASGDFETLTDLGAELGFEVHGVLIEESGERISSSWIRQLLIDHGDVEAATALLGRPYRMRGIVVHGDARGRELGYPTANLAWEPGAVIPADGVYAGWVIHGGEAMPAAISVGTNPHFEGHERRVESFILDRDDLSLYGDRIGVDFAVRLRPQAAFDSLEGYLAQMAVDVEQAREAVARQPVGGPFAGW
jgi:riboflavin kinase / FMN adenylyltransferase